MATGMLIQIPGMNSDVYDSVMEHLDWDTKPLPQGFVSHYAGSAGTSWVIYDVWESEEAMNTFTADRLVPAIAKQMADMGADPSALPQPEIQVFEAHDAMGAPQ